MGKENQNVFPIREGIGSIDLILYFIRFILFYNYDIMKQLDIAFLQFRMNNAPLKLPYIYIQS